MDQANIKFEKRKNNYTNTSVNRFHSSLIGLINNNYLSIRFYTFKKYV